MCLDPYRDNKVDWEIGSIVIHRADAKKSWMLMIALNKRKNGQIGTRYIMPGRIYDGHSNVSFGSMPRVAKRWYGKLWWNDKAPLLDPARFDIDIPAGIVSYWDCPIP